MERKKAIVTGAGTGIGQGIAIALGQNGYDVVVHYNTSAAGAEETCRQIRQAGGNAWAIQADLSDPAGVSALFRQAMERLEGLDLYVNNSGITRKSDILETTEAFFDQMVDVDLKSAYFCIQAAAREMVGRNTRGSIVMITSNNGLQQRPNFRIWNVESGADQAGTPRGYGIGKVSDPGQHHRAGLDGHAQNLGSGGKHHLQYHSLKAVVQAGGDRTHGFVPGIALGGVHYRELPGGGRRRCAAK